MKITKVYILGSGASKPDGVPLMNEFISEGFYQLYSMGETSIINDLFEFINRSHNLNIQYNPGILDGDVNHTLNELDETVGIEKLLSDTVKSEDIKSEEAVKKFIFATIDIAQETNYHNKFVANKILDDFGKSDIDIVIISFNYDNLLQRALLPSQLSQKFSYLIPLFENSNNRINFDTYMSLYDGKIKLLKLHGSLNWVRCNNCSNIQLYWDIKFESVYNISCKNCNRKELSPILIPPIIDKTPIFKKYNDIFEPLWNEAENSLKKAGEIIVIGYAFREADNEARSRIGRAINSNPNSPTLTIVDRNPNKIVEIILEISGITKNKFSQIKQSDRFEKFSTGSCIENLR